MTASRFERGPLAAVEYEAAGDRWTLIFVRELHHPLDRVWKALSDPAQLEQWAPFNADRDLGRTGPATLAMVNRDERHVMSASVLRVEPPTLLEYTWGPDVLRWHLEALPDGTRLTLRHTVAEYEMGPKLAAGWHLCLVVADRLLDGAPVGRVVGEDAMGHGWPELHDQYSAVLDAEGSRPV